MYRDLGLAHSKVSGALAASWLRRFATHYRVRLNVCAAFRMMLLVALRNFLHDYIRARDTEMAHTVRMEPASPNLDLSSPGRQSSIACHLPPESSSAEQRGAKRASKNSRGPGAALSETTTRRWTLDAL